MEDGPRQGRVWPRALALFGVTLALSVVEPLVLIGVPYVLLVLLMPRGRFPALLAAALALLVVSGGGARDGLWFVERGWAILLGGWFVALTLRWPASSFAGRALGSLAGSLSVAALVAAVRPGSWEVLDWLVADRVRSGVATALQAFRVLQDQDAVPPALVATVYETAELQARIFPAMIGLASVAALGVAWWMYQRLARGENAGLGPVREFRFNDQLVWLFIGGLGLLLLGGEGGWSRAGSNAVVFMGALYALRGIGVVLFFSGGLSAAGAILLALGLLFLAPVVLVSALVIGLGDTWLDLRERARQVMA